MSARPPAEKALFDRVTKMLDASKAQTPTEPDHVTELSDLDAALSLVLVLCADVDVMTNATRERRYCGHCRVHDPKTADIFATLEDVQAHIVRCPHNPLVRAVWTALNAIDAHAVGVGLWTPDMKLAYETALDTLRGMVGR